MPSHQSKPAPPRPTPRLYLVTPDIEDADAFAPQLGAALAAADVAAVLLRFAEAGESTLTKRAKLLVPIVQQKDAAAILDGHAALAALCGADGAHLTGLAAFEEAVETLKPARIAGAGGLLTRHDAMLAAERGADYVLFGGPDENGRHPSFDVVIERLGWWAEVFAIPCVGFAAREDEIAPLLAAGADFVALGDWIWSDARGPALAVAAAARLLGEGAGSMTALRRLAAILLVAAFPAAAYAQAQKPKSPPPKPQAPATTAPTPNPAPAGPEPDLPYGAFQRGFYLTAFFEATKRADQKGDPKAMTLLGELYANGLGVPQNDAKALEWYRLAADRGDREAMFAIAMFRMAGRAGAKNREEAARLFAAAAKLGHTAAAYNLGLLYMEGQQFPQDFSRAAELFRAAARLGNAESQYALATLYKEGRGVPKDPREAAKLMEAASLANYLDAEVEYAIALFNGEGVAKDETAAVALFLKAARRGSPIAQNRLARVLATGRGIDANPTDAAKWYAVSRAGGAPNDLWLDGFVQKLTPEIRAAAEKAAKPWLTAIAEARQMRP